MPEMSSLLRDLTFELLRTNRPVSTSYSGSEKKKRWQRNCELWSRLVAPSQSGRAQGKPTSKARVSSSGFKCAAQSLTQETPKSKRPFDSSLTRFMAELMTWVSMPPPSRERPVYGAKPSAVRNSTRFTRDDMTNMGSADAAADDEAAVGAAAGAAGAAAAGACPPMHGSLSDSPGTSSEMLPPSRSWLA